MLTGCLNWVPSGPKSNTWLKSKAALGERALSLTVTVRAVLPAKAPAGTVRAAVPLASCKVPPLASNALLTV